MSFEGEQSKENMAPNVLESVLSQSFPSSLVDVSGVSTRCKVELVIFELCSLRSPRKSVDLGTRLTFDFVSQPCFF